MSYLNAGSKADPNDHSLDTDQEKKLKEVAIKLSELNNAIAGAVDSQLTMEIVRTHRYHAGVGWGDQLATRLHAAVRKG